MNRKIRKLISNLLTFVMVLAMAIPTTTTKAVTETGIVKGSDSVDVTKSFSTVLTTGEKTEISITNSILTISVDGNKSIFKIGNITKNADAAVVNEQDGLLHIITLAGVYYVYDLYTGVQIVAYRNSLNGMYCSYKNSNAYMVYGRSLINNKYFYELLTSNSVSRDKLMSRVEFDIIIAGGDPSEDEDPTQAPTQAPTQKPTQKPTEEPTQAPTQKPTEEPTEEPTQRPTQKPTEEPTEEPTQKPTQKPTEEPTEEPTQRPTQKPTEEPTQAPTQKPTEAPTERPTETPTEKPTTKKASLKVNKTVIKLRAGSSVNLGYTAKVNGKRVKATLKGGAGCFTVKVVDNKKIKITAKTVAETTYGTFYVKNGSKTMEVTVIVIPAKDKSELKLNVTDDIICIMPGNSYKVKYTAKDRNGKRVKASKVYTGSSHVKVSWNKSTITLKTVKSARDSIFTTVTVKYGSYTKKIFVVTKPVEHVSTKTGKKIIKVNRYNMYNEFQTRIILDKSTKKASYNGITMENVIQVGFIKNSHNVAVLTADGNLYSLPKKNGNIILLGTNVKKIGSDKYGFITSALYNTDQSISIVGL